MVFVYGVLLYASVAICVLRDRIVAAACKILDKQTLYLLNTMALKERIESYSYYKFRTGSLDCTCNTAIRAFSESTLVMAAWL